MDLDKYIQIFFSEAGEYLQQIYNILLKLENGFMEPDLINQLMSNAHSIKGMARTVGFSEIEELSHGLEDFIQKLPAKKTGVGKEINLLFEGFQILEQMIGDVKSDSSRQLPYRNFLDKLKAFSPSDQKTPGLTLTPVDFSPKLKEYTYARVKAETLDNLLNIASECLICQNRLETISKAFAQRNLRTSLFQMKELVKELHLQITIARMMPIKILTDRVNRIVRNLAAEKGKEIEFKLKGEDLEMDRAIIEGIEEPLLHIIRNSIDHGIEAPQEREKRKKPTKGTITLTLSRLTENILIEVEDDGQGINPRLIKEKGLERGFITPEEAKNLSDEEALMMICIPNFSTADEVTKISGRGQGMNIVKNKIKAMGGSIAIYSQEGMGSRIVLRLPLTLSIMPAFIVKVGSHFFAIPIARVVSNAMILPKEISLQNQKESFTFRKAPVPLFRLNKLIKLETPFSPKEEYLSAIIAEISSRRVGLIVDELVGQQEVVIKPLKPPLNYLKVFSGITLLGTGEITLVLNLEEFELV